MTEIKKIDKISLADIVGLLYAVFGFFATIIIFAYTLISSLSKGEVAQPLVKFIFLNIGVGIWAGVMAAIIAGIAGWIIGFFAGMFYNLLVKRFGGIKVELKELSFTSVGDIIKEKEEFFKY